MRPSRRLVLAAVFLAPACGPATDHPGTGVRDYATLSEFLSVCAKNGTLPGVDVSTYQGSIDWGAVAGAGIRWAYAKATESTDWQDPTFHGNWSGMQAHGIARGAYHFFHPGVSGKAQADYYLAFVGALSGSLPPMLDWEVTDNVSGGTAAANARAFIAEIAAKTGRQTVIYTSPGLWDGFGAGDFGSDPLWVADWTYCTSGCCPIMPSGWGDWVYWQWSDKGTISGIPATVDLDVFNGDLASLQGLSDRPPEGWLDSVACDTIAGWAYDPDTPGSAISVDIYYGGPAGSGAPGVRWTANVYRADLCSAIGSCDHGFVTLTPRALLDDAAHSIYPYAIDSSGNGDNPILSGAPKTLQCAPDETGVRRHVVDPASLSAWGFSALMDIRPVSDAALAAWADAGPWPEKPQLVQGVGDAAIWMVDGPFRRNVKDPESMGYWHFASGQVVQEPLAQVTAMPQGPDLRERPMLVRGASGEVDVLDDPLPVLDAGTPGVGDADAGGSAADAGEVADAGSSSGSAGSSGASSGSSGGSVGSSGASSGSSGGSGSSSGASSGSSGGSGSSSGASSGSSGGSGSSSGGGAGTGAYGAERGADAGIAGGVGASGVEMGTGAGEDAGTGETVDVRGGGCGTAPGSRAPSILVLLAVAALVRRRR